MASPARPPALAPEQLRKRVEAQRWYHTIQLGQGIVTPGFFNHAPHVHRYGLPDDLTGARALDVGQLDGFWSFEMERRGAEVLGIDLDRVEDLDWPPRLREEGVGRAAGGFPLADDTAFRLAREALGSRVERVAMSAYEATPERLGRFDLVFVGSMLVHLRDPMLALERLASVCSGQLIMCEPYARVLGLVPGGAGPGVEFLGAAPWMTWWQPSVKAWMSMVHVAGFEEVERKSRFKMPFSDQRGGVRHVVLHARGSA